MKPPKLKTKNFIIRPFAKKDLILFTKYRSNKNVEKYQGWSNFTYEDAVEFFDGMDYALFGTVGCWFQLAIASFETDELLGDIAVHFIDDEQIEIGFTVSPDYQNQGVATEAVTFFLEYVFKQLKRHRVIAITDTRNIASFQLLEKLGFRKEGHFIQNVFFKGKWGDEYLYALLKSEI